MSKTNHRDGTVKKRFWLGQQRGMRYGIFVNHRKTADNRIVVAGSNCSSESSRGVQRDRAGAKKFVHSRTRFRDRMECGRIVREGDYGN